MDTAGLKIILDLFQGDANDLYDSINYISMKSNKFNVTDYFELLYKTMYLYHRKKGIENISKKFQLPIIIDREISYDKFKKYLNELKQYEIKLGLLPNVRNHFDNVLRLSANKLLGIGGVSWSKVYSSKITGQEISECGKMYVSVDNKDLYKFANLLLEKCLENGLNDYEFKVNDNEEKTRCDNVVIYFTNENFNKYISIIEQIFIENPDIQINQQNVLAYSINDKIKIAQDYDNGNVSYTNKLCNAIIVLRDQYGLNNEQIIEIISKPVNERMERLASMLNLSFDKKI